MEYISATDARNNLSALIDHAQREPLMIQKKGRDVAVMISKEDFEKMRRQNIEEFKALCEEISQEALAAGITEETLADILSDTN